MSLFSIAACADDPPPRREPRRLARLAALDTAVEALFKAELERIDRRARLPAATVAEVNRLLARGRGVFARAPAELVTPPFAPGTPVRPGDAVVALLKLRRAIHLEAEALLTASG